MRMIFGALGLLLVLAIAGVLAKKQLGAGVAPGESGAVQVAPAAAAPRQQVQQFEQAVQGAMQQARPLPADDQ